MEDSKKIMTLTDENGKSEEYELLDIVQLNEKLYTVFISLDEKETEVTILRVEDADDLEKSKYVVEQDQKIIQEVFNIFKEKYKDEFIFE